MTREEALRSLTPEGVRGAVRVLAAIDMLQGELYRRRIEPRVRKVSQFSESDEFEKAQQALTAFLMWAPCGNNQAVRMLSSVMVNSLLMLDMENLAKEAVDASSEISHD